MKVKHHNETSPAAQPPIIKTPQHPHTELRPPGIPLGEVFPDDDMPPEIQDETTRPPWTPDPGE